MRSVKMWSGAWIAAMASVAIGIAGGCAHGGSSGTPATEHGYAFAGHGLSCQLGDRLPGSTGASVATLYGSPPAARTRADAGCMNAVMTVTAHEGSRLIRRWRGQVSWTGAIADDGDEYLGYVGADERLRWVEDQAGPIWVETDRDGRGGIKLSRWLPDNTTRVTVLVQRGYGTGTGAGLAARGSDGYAVVTGTGEHDGGSSGDGDGALDGGLGDTGSRGPSLARGGAGTDPGAVRGSGARGHRGAGTSSWGSRAGSGLGGERASWSQAPSAALSRHGGRTPRPGGVEGGSAGGHGRPGDQGLSVGIAVFGGVIVVPAGIAPLLETTALLADAGVSPTALARKWLDRALRVTGDRLRREIASHAAELATRHGQSIRAELSRVVDYARLPAAEQGRILDAATDAFQREYFEKLERAAASSRAKLERGLADHAASPPRAGTPAAHVERLMRQDLHAAERVQLAAQQARAELRPRVKPPAARGGAAAAKGLAREREVAELVGGTVSRREVIVRGLGSTDIDVIGPAGEFIAVGGPAKAHNLSRLGRQMQILREAARQEGVAARAYFERGTPESALNIARRFLGKENVIVF